MYKKIYKCLCGFGVLSLILPLLLCAQQSKPQGKIETIQWDGDCVTLEDFKLIEIDSTECESFPNISEHMKASSRIKLINDTVIAYCENEEFNLLRIANLNPQEVIELLPVMIDGAAGPMSTISQIMPVDDKIWVTDWKNFRLGILNNNESARFDSIQLFFLPDEFLRIVPQKGGKFAYMPRFKDDIRVEVLDTSNNSSVLSKKFPPVSHRGSLNNMMVQGEMDVSPDMSYFVISTFGWDFIEIYKDGEVKMIRGPFFNETRFVPQGNMEPFMIANEKTTFSCLRVGDDKFAVGIADQRLDEPKNTVIKEIKTVLIFSKDGEPLYRLSLPNVVYEFAIDYKNNELLTLEDYFNPKLKRYKINVPLDLKQ